MNIKKNLIIDSSQLIYPRVLIICESTFSLDNGFGVTLTNLFQGWPSDRLGLFNTKDLYNPSDREISVQALANIPSSHGRRYALPMLLGLVPEWRGQYSVSWLRRNLKYYKPEVVYSFFHQEATMHFGGWISNQLSIPHIIHTGDDGLGTGIETINHIKNSYCCLAISEEMSTEYFSRYGRDFKVVRNGATSKYFPTYTKVFSQDKEYKTIRYLGRLHSWLHYDSLRLLANAVNNLKNHSINWKVELYGSADVHALASSGVLSENVIYKGQVGDDEGISLLHSADLLVVPLTYDESLLKSYRLSFPTKLAEFLATGRPVLMLSSPLAASAIFCKQHSVAHLIDRPLAKDIASHLESLWNNPDIGIAQGVKNIAVCRNLLDMETIRVNFQKLLCSTATDTILP